MCRLLRDVIVKINTKLMTSQSGIEMSLVRSIYDFMSRLLLQNGDCSNLNDGGGLWIRKCYLKKDYDTEKC